MPGSNTKTTALFILAVISFFLFQIDNAQSDASSITAMQTQELLKAKKAILIDVREEGEAADGMAEPAELIPLSDMNANSNRWQGFVKKLSKDKEVIIYCRSGKRAGVVGEKLTGMGYKVRNLGGFSSWQGEGLPVKKYTRKN